MVNEAMLPRTAVREVEQRLTAAGCPDADFDARELFRLATGRDVRLSDRPLTAEQAAALEVLCTRRAAREPLQYLCGSWSFLDFELAVGPGVLCPRADTEVVAQAAAETLAGIESPRVLDLCAGTGCLGLGVKRFCPAAQVTCVEKSPAAFVYLEKNARCALTGQGRQTENVLEPSALEQADAPALDWGPALNALRAGKKPVYAVQPVQADLFTYWETLPEGQLELRRDGAAAARGGAGACYGAGSRGGRPCILPGAGAALPKCAVPRRGAGVGDRLAAAGSCNRPAGRERMGRYPLHTGLWRQRPLCDRSSRKINWKKQTTSCCNILILSYTKKESEGQPALCGPKG